MISANPMGVSRNVTLRIARRLLAAVVTLCALPPLTSCSGEPPVLQIGSGGSLGNYYSAARAIARVVNKQQEANRFRLAYVQTTGSVSNINAILSGQAPFGIAQADVTHQAVNGLADWKKRGPQADVRAMFSLYTDSITVVATPESGILTTSDLVGKRVDIGHPDSGVRRNAVDALDALGFDWRAGTTVLGNTPADRSSMYLRGELDAFFMMVGHPTTELTFAVNSVPGARLVAMDNVAQLLAEHSYYSRSVIPVALYPGIENTVDVETVGVKAIFVTSAALPDEVVYAITRTVFEGLDELGKYDPVMQGLTRQGMVEGLTAPIHPGAEKYYREIGLSTGS